MGSLTISEKALQPKVNYKKQKMHTWNMQERSRVLNKPESVVFFTEKEINERRPKGKL